MSNEIIRLLWYGQQTSGGLFDSQHPLSVFVQFQHNVEEAYLRAKLSDFLFLKNADQVVKPRTRKVSAVDKSEIIGMFQHERLKKGQCYDLVIDANKLGAKFDEKMFKNETGVCMSNCECNSKGTQACDEEDGECICKKPYRGDGCRSCDQGYVFNPET